MHKRTVLLLSMLSLGLSACAKEEIRSVSALRPDKTNPERFVCDTIGTRPTIEPEYQIQWEKVAAAKTPKDAVNLMMVEYSQFIERLRDREAITVAHIFGLESNLSTCAINMQWQRDFYAGLDAAPPASDSR